MSIYENSIDNWFIVFIQFLANKEKLIVKQDMNNKVMNGKAKIWAITD